MERRALTLVICYRQHFLTSFCLKNFHLIMNQSLLNNLFCRESHVKILTAHAYNAPLAKKTRGKQNIGRQWYVEVSVITPGNIKDIGTRYHV